MADSKAVVEVTQLENISSGGQGCDPDHGRLPKAHVTLWRSVREWPRVVGYCVALSSAILLYGYDLVIVGTVSAMPVFQ